MYQAPLPKEYADLSPEEADARISAAKAKLGKRVVILGHHYQRDEIIKHADYRGDSYKLAKDATRHPDADYIVFCGVHFMAETADILAADHQKVILPNMAAGCSMADMANLFQVRKGWSDLEKTVGARAPTGESGARLFAERRATAPSVASRHLPLTPSGEDLSATVVPVTYINSAA